ncbi:hypothetical protein RZS08_44890, partial [Arthrospira platensis SPKY1]|nr:hypothetical protein [Arthrospira platensis SPKY1]
EFERFNTDRLSGLLDAEMRRQAESAAQRIRTVITAYGMPQRAATTADASDIAEWVQATLKELIPALGNFDLILAQAGERVFAVNRQVSRETQRNAQQFADLKDYFARVNGWYTDSA